MNLPLIVIGGTLALFGVIAKSKRKDLTLVEDSSKKKSLEAKTVPSDEINHENPTTSDNELTNVDDLGTDET